MKTTKTTLELEKGEVTYINTVTAYAYCSPSIPVVKSSNKAELFSNCCFAPILGQFAMSKSIIKEGICSKCLEHAIFDTMENFAYNCE